MKDILQRKQLLILVFLLLICLGLRLAGCLYFWHNGSVAIQSPDAYYHMRRILLALFAPPLGSIDFFRGLAPDNPYNWTVYYDYFYAGIIFLFSLGKATASQAELIASVVPPFIGTASALLLFLITREFGLWTAIFSVALFMILPKNISVSVFGEIDHHCFEVMCYLGAVNANINLLKNQGKKQVVFFSFWLVALFLVWVGSTMYVGLLAFSSLLWSFKHDKKSLYVMFWSYLAAGLVLLPFYLYSADTNNFKILYNLQSLFQPLFLIAIAFFFYITGLFLNEITGGNKTKIPAVFCFIGIAIILFSSFINGLSFIFGKKGGYDYAPFIGEFQPLLDIGLLNIVRSLTPLCFLAPLPAGLMFNRGWQEKDKIAHFMIAINFFYAVVLTIPTQRFLYLLAVFIVPVLIRGISEIISLISLPILRQAVAVISACLMIIPVFPLSLKVIRQNFFLSGASYDFFDWIKKNTPVSGDFYSPEKMPLYSILAHWDQGNYLIYLAQRPSVADNAGFNATVPVRFFLSQSESEAEQIIKAHAVRYVMVSPLYLYDNSFLRMAGESSDNWQHQNTVTYQDQQYLISYPAAKFIKSTYMRLYFQDGSRLDGSGQEALQHFRLVYENGDQVPVLLFPDAREKPPFFLLYGETYPSGFKPVLANPYRYKLFEYVPGAAVTGKTAPNQQISAYTFVRTNTGRRFIYRQTTKSDSLGNFKMFVPYGKSAQINGTTGAISDYIVNTGSKSFPVTVTNEDVLANKTINLQ
jgi:asparagine N-glycosylation enzyme membrane subunit Stt3